jgi:hypothetical protein
MWWPQRHGGYAARGIFGQGIYVNPAERLVIAQQAAREAAAGAADRDLQTAMETAVIRALSDQ